MSNLEFLITGPFIQASNISDQCKFIDCKVK